MSKTNNNIVNKLVEKSQEAFIVAIELYNKPTIKYRVEGFSFFICNAWELLLKAYIIATKGESQIYYKDNPNRTISLELCIKKIFTNDKDPLRKNLEHIIDLRNISTHYITEEYEQIYVPLFQSCVLNYTRKLLDFFDIDITEKLSNNFLTLSVKLSDIDEQDINARYPKQIADKLLLSFASIESSINNEVNPNYAINVVHEYYLTKNKKTATATIAIDNNSPIKGKIIKEYRDQQNLCPFIQKTCLEKVNKFITTNGINFINPSATEEDKKHVFTSFAFGLFNKFYDFKNNPKFCYVYTRNNSPTYSYSQLVIDLICDEIKKDPENIVQNLKSNLKQK